MNNVEYFLSPLFFSDGYVRLPYDFDVMRTCTWGVLRARDESGKSLISRRGWGFILKVLLAASLAEFAIPAGAATPASVTPAAPTPGQVESTLPTQPALPQIKSAPLTATPPPAATEVAPGGPTVTVTSFDITGNAVFDESTLQAQVASYLGKDLTLAELYKVADLLTRYYQAHGYGLARATLPEQQLSGGRVVIQMIEGRIGALSVEGNTRTRTGVILKQADAVKSGDVYTDAAMDRATLLANDLPAVQLQAVLQPGATFGTADVVYKVQETSPYSGQLSLDDYGRSDVGRWRLNAEANVSSLTGSGDRLMAELTHTESDLLNFGALDYSLPLGAPGGRLTAAYNQSEYRVGGPVFSPLGLSGQSRNGNLSYLYPEIRSHAENLYLGAGFAHEGSESDSDPAGSKHGATITETELNLLQLTGIYSVTHDDGSAYTLNGSFASNGRRDDGNRADAERARLEVDASHVQPFAAAWALQIRGSGVWSPDPLSDTEKFSLGGPDSVRGFPSADARGDSGLFASVELQRNLGPAWPLSIGWFVDSGKVWSKRFDTEVTGKDAAGKTVTESRPTPGEAVALSSVGTELIFESSDKRWESRLQWAWGLGGRMPSDGDSGGHIWATFGMNF